MLRLVLCSLAMALASGSAVGAEPSSLQWSAGGFLKVHALLGDIGASRDLRSDQELFIPQIPVTARPAGDSRRHHLHARASRLWLRLQTETSPVGAIELFAEGDWFQAFDEYRPRLRHAYLRAGRLLVGQTWSTFVNPQALADIDAGTAVGNSVTRLQQLRWTLPLRDDLQLHMALEDPVNRLQFSGNSSITAIGRERPYDLALRLDSQRDWGSLSLAGVWRVLSVTSARLQAADRRTVTAYSLAGRIDIGTLDNLRFMLNAGSGLARHSTLGTFADAVVNDDGALEGSTGITTMVAWQHFWSRNWRSTFALSTARSNLPAAAAATLTRSTRSAHANLIWSPGSRWSLGAEYLYGWRELQQGADGELQRLQFTFRLNF